VRVHVTGGSGFLGGSVIPRLIGAGHVVTALARTPVAARLVEKLGAEPAEGDLDHPASLAVAFGHRRPAVLVNLASLGFGHAPAVVAAAKDAGLTRAVFVSTTAIFTTLNAASKAMRTAAEESIMASDLAWTIIRPTMIYGGAGDRNMARLLRLIQRSPVVPLPGGGAGLQQPVHVEDLADAIVACLDAEASIGQAYDVAGPEPLSLRQVVQEAGRPTGRHPFLLPVPLGPAVAAARVYERTSSRPRLKAEQLERLGEDKAFDIGPARRDLAYRPRSFREGIAQEWEAIQREPTI